MTYDPQQPTGGWQPRDKPLGPPAAPVPQQPMPGYPSPSAPTPYRPRRRSGLLVALVVAVLLVAGGTTVAALVLRSRSTSRTAASSSSSAAPATAASSAPTGAVDGATQKICDLNDQISNDTTGTIMDHGAVVRQIAAIASQSSDFEVRFNATMLGDRYDLADHARNRSDALPTALAAFDASLNLGTACIKAGWHAG